MLGINTGNPEADSEAGMWLMALIGTLAAAVPVAFLSPSLGKTWPKNLGEFCNEKNAHG
jgi:hypothetical protein